MTTNWRLRQFEMGTGNKNMEVNKTSTFNSLFRFDFSQSRSQLVTVESIRLFFLLAVFLTLVIYQVLNTQFISYELSCAVYGLLALSFLFNLIYLLILDRYRPIVWATGALFVWDLIYVTLLIRSIGVSQSLLIFLYLINIILCGIVFQRRGGIYLAFLTSLGFSLLLVADPQITGNTLYFVVGINNLAFFAVAYLSGYLSEQLNFMGLELLERGRDIRALKNLNNLIIDGMPSGLLTVDTQGLILQSNAQAEKILSPQQTLIGLHIQKFIPPFRDLLSRISLHSILETQLKDQRILRLSFSSLNDEKGQRIGSIILFDDVTQMKTLENRVMQSEKMAAIGQLAAGIAHEIRNPLASISGSVQLMQSTVPEGSENNKLMSIAIKEIDRLNLLITEFLDYARPSQSQQMRMNISLLISELIESLALDPLAKNVDIQMDLEDSVFISGNSNKLKQAFLNILVNALQSMETTAIKKLKVTLKMHKERAMFTIRDTGCGIPESQLKKIFEPFHTTKNKGTGLGLAIVHSILEAHQATIDVESTVGAGTEFRISFKGLSK